MRALAYSARSTAAFVDIPEPTPAPGDVIIRPVYTGICGTDVLVVNDGHSRATPPVILGHEFSGVIAATSLNSSFRPGDRVCVEPLLCCDTCPACKTGRYNDCSRLRILGIDADGSLARYVKVPERLVVPLPEAVSLRDGALAEPLAVAVHLLRQVGSPTAEDRVFVAGGGPIGMLAANLLRSVAQRVVVSEPNPFRRAALARLGVCAVDTSESGLAQARHELGVAEASVCLEATGQPAGLSTCVDIAGIGSTIGLVGLPKSLPVVDTAAMIAKEVTLTGSRVYTRRDITEALTLLNDRVVDPDIVISHEIAFDDAIEAGLRAVERGDPACKILISQEGL